MHIISLLNEKRKKLEAVLLEGLSIVSLAVTFIIGIGVTSLIAKIIGKSFLHAKKNSTLTKTDWQQAVNRNMF